MKKPIPKVIEIKEMDLLEVLDYLDSRISGTRQELWEHYSKLGFINNNVATYLPFPEQEECSVAFNLIKIEFPQWENLCFNIFW